MEAIHTFVTEVLSYLVYTFKATYDKSFQIEFSSYTHIHIYIERIEMGDKRTGASTTGNALQCRSLYLCISSLVEEAAHSAQYGSTLKKRIFYAIINYQVYIALTIAKLWVVKLIVSHTIFIFNYWKRL